MNIADLAQVVVDTAKIISAAYKTKQSVLNAVGFVGPLLDLRSANFAAALSELKSLSNDDILSLEAAFRANLDFGDQAVTAKVLELEGYLEQAVTLVQQAVVLGEQAIAWEKQVQSFLGF